MKKIMKNLFVINSPLHLMSAFILSNTKFRHDDNYLALVHPHGFAHWQEDPIMDYMSSTKGGFKGIFPLLGRMSKEQAKYIKNNIGVIGFDNAFVGSDVNIQDQLLMSALNMTTYYRLDDGMWSYYNEDRKRPWHKAFFHKLQLEVVAYLYGINSSLKFNTIALGESEAGLGDYLFMPKLLKRKSPQVFEITSAMIEQAMVRLSEAGLLQQELFDYDYVVYLSQPVTENGQTTFEEEKKIIDNLMNNMDEHTRMIYKPHPNDKAYKLQYIKENFPKVIINDSKIPIEIVLYKEPLIKQLISYQTTTLIIAEKFVGRKMECISMCEHYQKPLCSAYKELMKKASVKFL